MRKNLNESKELARWIGDSRHDTELEANIDTLTECLPCLISIAAASAGQDKKALGKAIESIAATVCTLREIADDIFG